MNGKVPAYHVRSCRCLYHIDLLNIYRNLYSLPGPWGADRQCPRLALPSLLEDMKAHTVTVHYAINSMRSGTVSVLLIALSLVLSRF